MSFARSHAPQSAQHSRRLPDPLARQPSVMLRRCCASCKEALLVAHHARKLPPFRAVRNHDDGVPATEWMAMPFGPRLCCLSSSCSMVPSEAGFMSGNGFQHRALDQRMLMPAQARFRCWKAPSGSTGRMPAWCVRRIRPGSARLPAQRSPPRQDRLPRAYHRRNGCRAGRASAAESNPGPIDVLKSTLPSPSTSNSCSPSSSTFLFRQVKMTSLCASRSHSGM